MPSRRQTALIAVGSAALTFLVMAATRPEPRVRVVSGDGVTADHPALSRVLPVFDLKGVPFGKALQQWADELHVGLVVHDRAMEAAGYDMKAPIDLHLVDVPADAALDAMLRRWDSNATVTLDHWTESGQAHVSTAEDAQWQTRVMRMYDVGELLERFASIDRSFWPSHDVYDGLTASSTKSTHPALQGHGLPPPPFSRVDALDVLTTLIRDNTGIGTWREDGGSVGSMQYWGDKLVITQTRGNHEQIMTLLHVLDEASAAGRRPNWSTTLPEKTVWN